MLNPENECAHLTADTSVKIDITIEEMFVMQRKLQDNLAARGKALDLGTASFKQRVDDLTVQHRNFTTEFVEMLERLPFKEWKTYSPEQLANFLDANTELEVKFEYVDMFHFFLNIGLLLGIDGAEFKRLYALKNKENFARQERGY